MPWMQMLGVLAVGMASFTLGACSTTTPHSSARATRCATDQLSVRFGPMEGGLGHWAIAVIFRNTSTATCTLSGYPKIIDVDRSGSEVASSLPTPNGYMGGLSNPKMIPVVTLSPSATATALLEGINAANLAHPCPHAGATATLVTPPGDTRPVRIAHAYGNSCGDVEIHPVVVGDSGSESRNATS